MQLGPAPRGWPNVKGRHVGPGCASGSAIVDPFTRADGGWASKWIPAFKCVKSAQGVTVMPVGAVKWFNAEKGFGFVTPDGGGDDLFVHQSEIQMEGFRDLAEGQRVEFETKQGQKGLQASQVRKI